MKNAQTILITGATTGIGRHAALYLAARGHRVIATGRNAGALNQLREDAGATPIETLRLDVTDAASIAAAVAEVDRLTEGRGVDALVNNAGYGIAAPLVETPDEEIRAQYETNVFGLMAVTRAFAPKMIDRGAGRIVNVSSVGGRVTFPLFGAYNSTKYAVESLSDALRRELSAFGVKVVLIEPGPIRSEFSNRSMSAVARHKSADSRYAGAFALADKIKAQADAQSASPETVARVIERAIVARRPAARYVVPFSSRIMVAIFEALPTSVADWILTRYTGLTRARLGAGSAAPTVRAEPATA